MKRDHYLTPALLAGLCLAGCQALTDASRLPAPPQDAPIQRGGTQTVEAPAKIGHLKAPATATMSEPVTIEFWAYIGASGCDGMGTPSLEVSEGSKYVTVRTTATHQVGDDVLCGMIYPGFVRGTVSFTPGATGSYEVKAEPFEAVPEWEREQKIGAGVTPVATLAIEVVPPAASAQPE